MRRLCRAVVDELGLYGATLTVMSADGSTAAAAASEDGVSRLEELQFILGEGPTGDAYATGRPVMVADLALSDGRWVRFSAAAAAEDVGAVYAFPLQLGAVRLGVLTCYSAEPRVLTATQVASCLDFAESARDLLLDAVADGRPGAGDVQRSLRIRTEVYQAQGMLMVELGVTLADALVRLRAMAYSEGLDVNELAADLVSGRRPMPNQTDDA